MLTVEGLALVGAAVLALFYSRIELAIMGAVSIYMLNILFDFLSVFQRVYAVAPVLAVLLFAPMIVLLPIVVLDWWRGRD